MRIFYGKKFNLDYRHLDSLVRLLVLFFLNLFIWYQWNHLGTNEWGDESETIVTIWLLSEGKQLYSEIFNQHGPLVFFPGLLLSSVARLGIVEHRIFILMFQVIAVASIYFSPILKTNSSRALASVVAMALISIRLNGIYGNTYSYQVFAGLLLVIVLSQYAMPVLLSNFDRISALRIVVGNAIIALLLFLSIQYLLVSLFIWISVFRAKQKYHIFLGIAIGLAIGVAVIFAIASVSGYAAIHLYLNAVILPKYSGASNLDLIFHNIRDGVLGNGMRAAFFIFGLASIALLVVWKRVAPWRALLIFGAFFSLLIREADFHRLPYYYGTIALLIICLDFVSQYRRFGLALFLLIGAYAAFRLSLVGQQHRVDLHSERIEMRSEFSDLVNLLTTDADRIISYSFRNIEYLRTNRLPAIGSFFFLPWQEDYSKSSVLGVTFDVCQEMKSSMPKVVLLDRWRVWDKFEWSSYGGCIDQLIADQYIKISDKPYYVRKDIDLSFYSGQIEKWSNEWNGRKSSKVEW